MIWPMPSKRSYGTGELYEKHGEAEERRPSRRRDVETVTVGAAATSLRQAKSLEGARKSYLEDLVFAHPQAGKPVDRSKVTERFQGACRSAGVTMATPDLPGTHAGVESRSTGTRALRASVSPTGGTSVLRINARLARRRPPAHVSTAAAGEPDCRLVET
jgi:hypothetical protein